MKKDKEKMEKGSIEITNREAKESQDNKDKRKKKRWYSKQVNNRNLKQLDNRKAKPKDKEEGEGEDKVNNDCI